MHKEPLYKYFNADPNNTPLTSYTISIGEMDLIPQKVQDATPYQIIKVKLGVDIDRDKSIIQEIRKETDKIIRVDANEGWDLETGLEMTHWLADQNIEFIEEEPIKTKVSINADVKISLKYSMLSPIISRLYKGIITGLLVFLIFSITAGTLMVAFTMMVAASESTIVDKLKASTRQIEMAGGVIMIIVGIYLMYYYLSTNVF